VHGVVNVPMGVADCAERVVCDHGPGVEGEFAACPCSRRRTSGSRRSVWCSGVSR
jgi:hypothetical protein